MLCGVFGGKEGDLYDGDGEGVGFWEGDFEGGPDAVVEAAAGTSCFDAGFGERVDYFLGNGGGAFVGVLFFVVVRGKAVKTKCRLG